MNIYEKMGDTIIVYMPREVDDYAAVKMTAPILVPRFRCEMGVVSVKLLIFRDYARSVRPAGDGPERHDRSASTNEIASTLADSFARWTDCPPRKARDRSGTDPEASASSCRSVW